VKPSPLSLWNIFIILLKEKERKREGEEEIERKKERDRDRVRDRERERERERTSSQMWRKVFLGPSYSWKQRGWPPAWEKLCDPPVLSAK
jgi:hypothetical protein